MMLVEAATLTGAAGKFDTDTFLQPFASDVPTMDTGSHNDDDEFLSPFANSASAAATVTLEDKGYVVAAAVESKSTQTRVDNSVEKYNYRAIQSFQLLLQDW